MPFQPGQSGNPAGSKKNEKTFVATVRKALAQEDAKRLRAAAEKLLDLAAEGEPWAIQMLADRLDGKPAQQVSVVGDDDAPPVAVKATVEFIRATAQSDVATPGST